MRYLLFYFILGVTTLSETNILAQDILNNRCGADEQLLLILKESPEKKQLLLENEEILEQFLATNKHSLHRTSIKIPVVIHVVFREDHQNISDLQILDQVDIINRAFSMTNRNLFSVPLHFRHLISDIGIEFCLAKKDPAGNATSGITRTKTSVRDIGSTRESGIELAVHFAQYGGSDPWDNEKYLNIWVAEMENNLAGNATFPGMAPYPEADGIVVNYQYFGSIGTATNSAPYNKGKTLVHEIGHYLNLFHPWGISSGGCNTDDLVDDTPLQESPYFNCNPIDNFSCGSEDLTVNFMDYTEDKCLAMFTHGQKERMIASLQLFRPGLVDNDYVCQNSEPNNIHYIDNLFVKYPRGTGKIIIYSVENISNNFNITIYDTLGRRIWQEKSIESSYHYIDSSQFIPGVYIVCTSNSKSIKCTPINIIGY